MIKLSEIQSIYIAWGGETLPVSKITSEARVERIAPSRQERRLKYNDSQQPKWIKITCYIILHHIISYYNIVILVHVTSFYACGKHTALPSRIYC